MENSLKGLMLAAGTIITCLIISLGFFIAKEAKDSATAGANQISKLNSEFIESDKVIYDSTEVSGSEVINCIRKFRNDTMGIVVTTKKGTTSYHYSVDEKNGQLSRSQKTEYKSSIEVTNKEYINPTARFSGSLVRDANDTIIGIKFVQN